jgi:hypothetical protein
MKSNKGGKIGAKTSDTTVNTRSSAKVCQIDSRSIFINGV